MNASPGQSLDLVLWEAKKELRAIHPRYARGVVMLGGWLLVPGNESAIASTTGKPVFRVTQQAMRNSTRLVFTLPEDAQVTLSIYDITGREAREISLCARTVPAPVKANTAQTNTILMTQSLLSGWSETSRLLRQQGGYGKG